MKTFFKYLLRCTLVVLSLIALYFVVAFILSYIPADVEEVLDEKNQTFYIQSNGTHLDIVLPAEAIDTSFLNKLQVPKSTKYLAFGWGNKEFYFNVPEWKDLSVGLAFRAAFMQLEAAQRVAYITRSRENWTEVKVSSSQMKKLNDFIFSSFVLKEKQLVKCDCPLEYQNVNFYDAKGNYSCINTCNVWVNDAMKASGVETSVWSPFHFGVLHHLE
ncbi:MAG: DUF2459 domain-containing protein [Bacteroidetes bacterium]|nr:DUF2459 domain-containing protein [Bacteroidota bacterium]